jgi:hypothetical protein
VIVESSDEWADRGLEIMHRRQAVDMDERTAHWRQEGWRGTAASAGSSPAAAALVPCDCKAPYVLDLSNGLDQEYLIERETMLQNS